MLQKRYQIFTDNGIEWTDWFDYHRDISLKEANKDIWQLRYKLKNEFRLKV